ncbi:hypothetical protein F3J37_01620 [Pantoea sp. Al-1710]|uniref:Uncharacterized protein n=1 Tax=Candidatus Pantoea communis TaxID=2608354 RepID=A0ABX0RIA4_9GAMM|nr:MULTISPECIES: M91 family zinc metallopeptidase [Pantoea]NIG12922.1 hypothetical protein [Pantoea sp. Cy-640]NIG17377.1 hypothetical protein [Pantoea communis]
MSQYSIQSAIAPFISIHHNNLDVMQEVDTALYKLERLPAGRALLGKLRNLSNEGRSLKIYASTRYKNIARPILTHSQLNRYVVDATNNHQMQALAYNLCSNMRRGKVNRGEGTSAVVYFNPMMSRSPDPWGGAKRDPNHYGNHFTLGHVLIHAMRMMKGNYQGGNMENYSGFRSHQRREEERALGIGEFYRKEISENKMRLQEGLEDYREPRMN